MQGLFWRGVTPSRCLLCCRQVKATELVESGRHSAGLVPRFARVVAVRADKHWHECVTTAELRQLRDRAGGKLATQHLKVRPAHRGH